MTVMRSLKRGVAHHKMKKAGYSQVNKGMQSYFSQNWRKFVSK